jgi:hypothetical protein
MVRQWEGFLLVRKSARPGVSGPSVGEPGLKFVKIGAQPVIDTPQGTPRRMPALAAAESINL